MKTFKIYLAGGVGNLTFNKQYDWREKVCKYLKNVESKYLLDIINPCDYYNFNVKCPEIECEVMEYDLWHVRNSDLILVNFNDVHSIGTAMELATAHERRIPIIGYIDRENGNIHSWLGYVCNRIFADMCEALEYIIDFYLK